MLLSSISGATKKTKAVTTLFGEGATQPHERLFKIPTKINKLLFGPRVLSTGGGGGMSLFLFRLENQFAGCSYFMSLAEQFFGFWFHS